MYHSKYWHEEALSLRNQGLSSRKIGKILGKGKSTLNDFFSKYDRVVAETSGEFTGPKVLVFDIEIAPVLGYVWSLWKQNVGLNQIKEDWYVLSWAAKWLHEDTVMYQDQRDAENIEDDKELLEGIWNLLDEAHVVVTQNGKKFDVKKLNARFILNGMKPPSSFRHIDTLEIAKRHFAFTSNKLQYMTDNLCEKYKKSGHQKFSGFELWKECLAGNIEAFDEMRDYNKLDVLSLEELYFKLLPWCNNLPNFNVYNPESLEMICHCGSKSFSKNGYHYTNLSVFHRYSCDKCGKEQRGRTNLLSKEKRDTLKMNIT